MRSSPRSTSFGSTVGATRCGQACGVTISPCGMRMGKAVWGDYGYVGYDGNWGDHDYYDFYYKTTSTILQ